MPRTAITPELLSRHNRPGPRYTSYPTAPQFHTDFDAAAYATHLTQANARADDPLSLYVHLPFCRERCHYCGCHVIIARRANLVDDYLDRLEREIDLVAGRLPDRRNVAQLHWGGGTPTYLDPAQMRRLHTALLRRFRLLPRAEVAIEIDPRVTTEAHVDALRELGFNRLSMGVQDLTPEVQAAVGRHQTLEQTTTLLDYCRQQGFTEFNVDLIYGLPRQSVDTFRESLRQVIAMQPGRVATYSYAHVPWIRPSQRKMDERELPDTATKLGLLVTAIEMFRDAGYVQIGMDHFAHPDDTLAQALADGRLSRNFMGYTVKPAPDMVGLGISGIGDVDGAYAQNHKKLSIYYAALDAGELPIERGYVLDRDDRIRRFVINRLMCRFELNFSELRERYDVDFDTYFATERQALVESVDPELFTLDTQRLSITATGRLFVRNVCMAFDRYLGGTQNQPTGDAAQRPVYSNTV